MQNRPLRILLLLVPAILLGAGAFLFLLLHPAPRQEDKRLMEEDFERLALEDYTSVFFSTFPVANYTEEDYIYYRGFTLLKTSCCIPDSKTLNRYFEKIPVPDAVDSFYLGIRPDIIRAKDLIRLFESYPEKRFEIIISYPSLEYWAALGEREYADTMRAYKDFINTLMPLCEQDDRMNSNCFLYFYGDCEWLVANPLHYENSFDINADISHMLSMYSDSAHGYNLRPDNYESRLAAFENIVETRRNNPPAYPDLSDWDIVFWGDSIIALNNNTSSVPEALSGLTGAHTYNCARGGSAAASVPESPFPGINELVDAFLAEDLSGVEEATLTYRGMSDYLRHSSPDRQKCFVLNFGLNDFFGGNIIQSGDPRDIRTYSGALRSAVEKLRGAYPDAVIILMAPSYTCECDHGTTPQSDAGGILTDYVAAAVSLSEEMGTLLFNSYERLGINSGNFPEYLADGTHPNESTRFLLAQGLAGLLRE